MAFLAFALLVVAITAASLFDMANCVKPKKEAKVTVTFTEIPQDVKTVYVSICDENRVPSQKCWSNKAENNNGTTKMTFKKVKVSGQAYVFWSKHQLLMPKLNAANVCDFQ
jgi:hypothetical protein